MEITLNLDDLIFEGEKNLLKNVLRCQNGEELEQALLGVGRAAMTEYLEMFLGKQLPTRADEMRERRLFHLLKHYFTGRIPNETEIATMFQLTESGSRSLLRNARTKFKFDLEEELQNTVCATLLTARQKEGDYRVVIQSENILEELRQTVSIKAPELDQISKVKNSAGVYSIPEDTFAILCANYGIDMNEIEAAANREG